MEAKHGKTMVIRSLVIITLLTLVLIGVANAATISVKQLGCGTETNCYTKINDAIFYAQPEDAVKVYPGRYEEAVVIDKNLTLVGSGPQVTTIYSPSDGITVNENMNATIIGFTVTASKYGINIKRQSQTIIRNNAIISNGSHGILIDPFGSTSSSIINNVISYNSGAGINDLDGCFSYCGNILIHNNIISTNGTYGINKGMNTNFTLSHNNAWNNPSGDYHGISAGTFSISENPLFIDPSSGNFALQSTSLCKDKGRPGLADADPDGTQNDMGAYGGPDAASFWPYPPGTPIITNLTVVPTSIQKGGIITIRATGEVW